jgi:hypothetical protein
MASRWTAPGGWTVETVAEHSRRIYRVARWDDWFVGYPQDLLALQAMLARSGVRLENLVEDTDGLTPSRACGCGAGRNHPRLTPSHRLGVDRG